MTYINLKISERISLKLKIKHQVDIEEIRECFFNRNGGFLEDIRIKHKADPKTLWFIAETDLERLLKVVFMELDDGTIEIKTAYEPNNREVKIYEKYS